MKLEIEFRYQNRNLYFRPLDRNVRGHFLLAMVAEPTAMAYRDRIPEDIPGQILGIDTEKGIGYLLEPIHDKPRIKEKIEKMGMTLEDSRQEFPNVEVDAWLYWIKAVVDCGKARVVNGKIPENVNYDPPPMLGPKPKRGDARLREIFQGDPSVAAQYLSWDEKQREEWKQLVGV